MTKICKNHKSKTYTGKENTPLGKGYHAEGEKIDKRMKGKDGYMYKVIKTKRTRMGFGGDMNPNFMSTRYNEMGREQKFYDEYERQGMDKGLEDSDLKMYVDGKMKAYKLRINQFENSKDVCDYFVKMEKEKGVTLNDLIYDPYIDDLVRSLDLNCNYENKQMLVTMLSNKYQNLDENDKLKSSKYLIKNYSQNLKGKY